MFAFLHHLLWYTTHYFSVQEPDLAKQMQKAKILTITDVLALICQAPVWCSAWSVFQPLCMTTLNWPEGLLDDRFFFAYVINSLESNFFSLYNIIGDQQQSPDSLVVIITIAHLSQTQVGVHRSMCSILRVSQLSSAQVEILTLVSSSTPRTILNLPEWRFLQYQLVVS
jgi:hypothetical protein